MYVCMTFAAMWHTGANREVSVHGIPVCTIKKIFTNCSLLCYVQYVCMYVQYVCMYVYAPPSWPLDPYPHDSTTVSTPVPHTYYYCKNLTNLHTYIHTYIIILKFISYRTGSRGISSLGMQPAQLCGPHRKPLPEAASGSNLQEMYVCMYV